MNDQENQTEYLNLTLELAKVKKQLESQEHAYEQLRAESEKLKSERILNADRLKQLTEAKFVQMGEINALSEMIEKLIEKLGDR